MIDFDSDVEDLVLLRRAFGCFPSGVVAVCAFIDGQPVGMAASSFTTVSLSPALASICVQDNSSTWPRLRQGGRIGLSVLSQEQQRAGQQLAAKRSDRFSDLQWETSSGGAVFLHGSSGWLDCSLHAEVSAGDHAIALLAIHGFRANPDNPPLIFHGSRFHKLAAVEPGT